MKKLCKYLLTAVLVLSGLQPMLVKAGSVSAWADSSTVEVGDTVTFTVSASNGAADCYISGAVNDHIFLDNESASFSVTADEAGTLSISVSGTIADNDGETEEDFWTSASVTVTDSSSYTPEPEPEPIPEPEPEPDPVENEKSDDARLYWLSVDKGTLTPEFSSDVTEYTVDLTSDENEITINADVWDDNATLSGTGLKVLKVGSNSFTIDVTAEDGTRKAYTVNVNVKEVPKVYFNFDDKKLGILNEVETGDLPKGFSEKTIQINGQDVKAFTNSGGTLTLIFMVDEKDNKGFYIYSEQEKAVLGLYKPLIIDGKEYFPIAVPENLKTIEAMTPRTINIENEILDCWNFGEEKPEELKEYSILYLMDTDGNTGYYAYNTKTKKLKAYTEKTPVTGEVLEDWLLEDNKTPWLLYGGIAAVVVLVLGVGAFVFLKKKKKAKETPSTDNTASEKQRPVRDNDRKLVTDDTFFKEVPHDEIKDLIRDDEIPLTIENALNSMDRSDLEETIIADKDQPKADSPAANDDEDDWLDEKLLKSVMSDDTDTDI